MENKKIFNETHSPINNISQSFTLSVSKGLETFEVLLKKLFFKLRSKCLKFFSEVCYVLRQAQDERAGAIEYLGRTLKRRSTAGLSGPQSQLARLGGAVERSRCDKNWAVSIATLLLSINLICAHTPFIYTSYHASMQTERYPDANRITNRIIGIDGFDLMKKFERLYEENNPTKIQPSAKLKIPKIIHQVWLGSPVPDEFKAFMQSWKDHHPDWQYKLWTDKEVAEITLDNQKFYDETTNYGVKSDLLKWEIIYRYGGVYVDTDFECLQPLDLFHYTYDFYTGIQPLDTQFLQLGAALFGGVPGHPILKHCIETIKDDWHKKGAPTKSGPVHFTKSFFAIAGNNGSIDIALPAHYFYPLGCREQTMKRSAWIGQGAYAVHHWARSWMPAKYRLPQFQKISNAASEVSWND